MEDIIKARRGFAAMDPERQRQIASRGGKIAHEKGKAHEFSSEEAKGAGRKGGLSISQDKAHMAAIGREGGFARARRAKMLREQAAREQATQKEPVPFTQSLAS